MRCDSLQCEPGAREGSVLLWNVCFQVNPRAAVPALCAALAPVLNRFFGPFASSWTVTVFPLVIKQK